jgi:hypothetical protein
MRWIFSSNNLHTHGIITHGARGFGQCPCIEQCDHWRWRTGDCGSRDRRGGGIRLRFSNSDLEWRHRNR